MNNDVVLQVGTKILLKNKNGRYLMLRRSLEKYPDIKGRWDIVGERITPGMPLLENLQREVTEETGLTLYDEPRLVAAQDILLIPGSSAEVLAKAGKHVVRLTYIGKVADDDIQLDTSENDRYKWYTTDELRQLDDVDIYFKALLEMNTIVL